MCVHAEHAPSGSSFTHAGAVDEAGLELLLQPRHAGLSVARPAVLLRGVQRAQEEGLGLGTEGLLRFRFLGRDVDRSDLPRPLDSVEASHGAPTLRNGGSARAESAPPQG